MVEPSKATKSHTATIVLEDDEVLRLRKKHYNATLVKRIDVHENLARFRVRPDGGIPSFKAGQYVAMGLGNWERRISDSQPENLPEKAIVKLVRRAYSICCPLLSEQNDLVTCADVDFLEFYVTLVRQAESEDQPPPALTPRLFMLGEGDRLSVARKITGTYVLSGIRPDETVLLLGTGTGEAPHNAMVAELLRTGHRGRIVVATMARYARDLGYRETYLRLARQYSNLVYLPLTTREPINTDPSDPNYVGKQYLQQLFVSGELARMAKVEISKESTHVFLCGNPAMIGYTPPGAPSPEQPGMLQLLSDQGFRQEDHNVGPGCVRFEKYW